MNGANPDVKITPDFEIDAEEMSDVNHTNNTNNVEPTEVNKKIEVNAEVIPFTHVNSMKLKRAKKKKVPKYREELKDLKESKELKEPKTDQNGEISETIVIENSHKILPRLTKQEKKWWHFKFKNEGDEIKLQRAFDKMNATVTIKLNDCGKKHPDILLTRNDTTVGKIHFLYFDRRDKDDPSKYYVKVFFYQMNARDFEQAKDIVVRFFAELSGYKKHPKRILRHKRHAYMARKSAKKHVHWDVQN
jgi:hypothetical protein